MPVRTTLNWAKAISEGDRAAILAHHANSPEPIESATELRQERRAA